MAIVWKYFTAVKGFVQDFIQSFATCKELIVLLASSRWENPHKVSASAELTAGFCNNVPVFEHCCSFKRLWQLAILVFFGTFVNEFIQKVINLWILLETWNKNLSWPSCWQWDAPCKLCVNCVLLGFARTRSCRLETTGLGPILQLVKTFLSAVKSFDWCHVKAVSKQLTFNCHI